MKKIIFTNLILLSSISFFSGCTNTPEPETKLAKESLSVYDIMGIVEPGREDQPLFVVKDRAVDNYSFKVNNPPPYQKRTYTNPDNNSHNIEVISYGSYQPEAVSQRVSNVGNVGNVGNSNNVSNVSNVNSIVNNIEWNAKSFLGTRYVWGATGPSKFDCSGFTQWVYRDVGINIPRVSRNQARVGDYVSFENLQRGDMVFFDTKKRRSGKVTHVGIYLGNNNFIHASSAAKKVVIYNFNQKSFYKERFLWGRRVINPNMHYALN